MQEEFEKKVRERMHTFGIKPSPQVWGDIDAVLNKHRHRRVFVGWWILLGLVIMAGVVLLYEKGTISRGELNRQPVINTDTTNNTNTANNNHDKLQKDTNSTSTRTTKIARLGVRAAVTQPTASDSAGTGRANNSNAAQPETAYSNSGSFAFATRKAVTSGPEQVEKDDAVKNNNTQNKQGAVAKNTIANTTNAPMQQNTEAARVTALNSQANAAPLLSAEPAPSRPLAQQGGRDKLASPLNAGPDTTAMGAADANNDRPITKAPENNATKNKFNAPKGHEWYITLLAGSTQTVSAGAFNTATPAAYASSPSVFNINVPAVTSLNAYNYNISQPGAGFHLGAGVLYEKIVSARWRVYGGLVTCYLSNTQKVGLYYKAPLSIAASDFYAAANGLGFSTGQLTLQSFYNAGNDATIVNKAWQVEVPAGVGFVFNPKSKTKFMLNTGLSLSWLFSSEWLIPDNRYDKLYYSKTVFNSTAFNWQLGPAMQFAGGWKVGLQYQQSFTTLAKDYVTPKLHWQNISVYTAIPLGRRKKH